MLPSYSVTKKVPLPAIPQQHTNYTDKENVPVPCYHTIGGVLSDTKFVWVVNGSRLIVVNSKTGVKVAAWNFGWITKDYSTKIVCVEELAQASAKPPLLIIGLQSDITGGMVCVFDMVGSRVLRAIQVTDKVTCIHVIDALMEKCPLPGPLRAFDGILSIGLAGGTVLLVDLCRQICEEASSGSGLSEIRDEINPCAIRELYLQDIFAMEPYKQVAVKNGEHLAVHLNAVDNNPSPHFILKGPKGDDRAYVNSTEVAVSALHYCPQLGSLLVGYNFGAWQLWDLIEFQLIYTSPIYEENVPVTHFAMQEPCDDPKAFCYVWVIYSRIEPGETGFPLAVLYSLSYESKEWHEGYGIIYQSLSSCSVRFQADLTLYDENVAENVPCGARCVTLQAISKTLSKGGALYEHQAETVSLCYMIWSGWSKSSHNVQTYMCLFDLNQWYKEQMPSSLLINHAKGYLTHTCLSKLLPPGERSSAFLDAQVDLDSLSHFFGSQKLEEHYYPASLAFELCAVRENDVVFFQNQGSQRAFLSHLETNGPVALCKPADLYELSVDLGLCPLFVDVLHTLSPDQQKELLLNIALEQQLTGFLCKCASTWSTGSFANSGCTLHFLLTWGWQRAVVLKQNADRLSIPLFDYSGIRLDQNSHNMLSNCARQLKNLATLFGFIVKRFLNLLLHPDVTKQQCESLQMASVHLEVLQWLLNIGLLPECPLSSYPRVDEFNRISAPYPVDSLNEYYDERRATLQTLSKEQFSTSGSLLFIDNLIELQRGGVKVQKQWEEDGGSGLYPPPSLQALLRTYLIEGVDIPIKHCIVVYVFLDLAMTLNQTRYKPIITHLIKFPAVFQLSPSIIKITQAFWHLDHGDFSTAMEQLLDPLISLEDLKDWHHYIALKALLAQDQHKLALHYLQVRRPSLTEINDLCTVISLFIANNMLNEAYHFQKQNRNARNEEKLLEHFFRECDRKGEISSVIRLTLTPTEEKAFVKYLQEVEHPKKQDLEVFYHILRSQYMNAFEVNEKYNSDKFRSRGLRGQETMNFRDAVVKEFSDILPDVTKSLMKLSREESSNQTWKEVVRPQPLSVFVHNTQEKAKYKSTLIQAALSKAKETWTHPILDVSIKPDPNESTIEQTPFLVTPKALHMQTRTTTPLIFPRITKAENSEDEVPSKRLKLSPRVSVTSPDKRGLNIGNADVKFNTPIIKRKGVRRSDSQSVENFGVEIPHSILKISLHSSDKQEDSALDDLKIEESPRVEKCRRSFGITPRRPLPRTPRHAVRFNISQNSSETSVASEPSFVVVKAMVHTTSELKQEADFKNSSVSTEEAFYSPETSLNTENLENSTEKNLSAEMQIEDIQTKDVKDTSVSPSKSSVSSKASVDQEQTENTSFSRSTSPLHNTPRSRRSYRASSLEPVRSSPRLRKSQTTEEKSTMEISESLEVTSSRSDPGAEVGSARKSRAVRRSLTRQVLESNTFSRLDNASFVEKSVNKPKVSLEKIPNVSESEEKIAPDVSSEKVLNVLQAESELVSKPETLLDESLNKPKVVEKSVLESSQIMEGESQDREVLPENGVNESELRDSNMKNESESGTEKNITESSVGKIQSPEAPSKFESFEKMDVSDINTASVSYGVLDVAFLSQNMSLDQTASENLDSDRNKSVAEVKPLSSSDQVISNVTSEKDPVSSTTEVALIREVSSEKPPESDKVDTEKQDEDDLLETRRDEKEKSECDSDADTVPLIFEEANIYDDLSTDNNYESGDPNLNVFEISDDLDVKEVIVSGHDANIMEADVNYTTSTSDNEVFADNCDVLLNEAILETSSTVETSENCDSIRNEKPAEESKESPKRQEEVIEIDSSSEEENSDASSDESAQPEELENVEVEEVSYSDESYSEEESDSGHAEESEEPEHASDSESSESEDSDSSSMHEMRLQVIPEEPEVKNEVEKTSAPEVANVAASDGGDKVDCSEGQYANSENLEGSNKEVKDITVAEEEEESEATKHNLTDYTIRYTNLSDLFKEYDMSFSQETNSDSLDPEDFKKNIEKKTTSTPARRSTRLLSLQSDTPDQLPSRRTRRSSSFHALLSVSTTSSPQPSTSRRKSVDKQTKEPAAQKRTLRSLSTDVDLPNDTKPKRTRRAASVHIELPVKVKIDDKADKVSTRSEKGVKTQSRQIRKAKSAVTTMMTKDRIGKYSATRRLTRRQAELLKKTLGAAGNADAGNADDLLEHEQHESGSESEQEERGLALSQLDPLQLLDKKSFEGKRDSDEEKHGQDSPPSTIPDSPIGSQSRKLRSRSSLSNISVLSDTSTTPKREKTAKRPGPSSRNQRSKSVDPTFTTQSSDGPSPPKLRKTRKHSKANSTASDVSSKTKTKSLVGIKETRTLRRRSASLDEIGNSDAPLRRSARHLIVQKTGLSRIPEEQNGQTKEHGQPAKRTLRKRSSAK